MMIKKRNTRAVAQFVTTAAAIFAVIFFGGECSRGAVKGIYFCAEVLVPSIFPFMVISVFVAKSGLSQRLGRVTGKVCRVLFGVSGNLSAVIIMSMTGGYPVGARGIAALRERGAISEGDAVKAAYFAVGAGPGFLITFVGGSLMSCKEAGACMLLAQVISVVLLGIINKLFHSSKDDYNSDKEINTPPLPFSSALTDSVVSSTYGMLEMCGMVVVFSAVIAISERLFGDYNVYLSVLLEVTSACGALAESKNIFLLAFAAGFGGLCVHFQIFTALGDIRINKLLFFLYRIIQGLITALLTTVFIKLFNVSLPVFSSVTSPPKLSLSTTVVGSVMLIACGAGLIYNIRKV